MPNHNTQNRGVKPTLYFGYGSNLWIDQMNRRCPDNKYIGLGVLREWCWIINQRGYANVVPSSGDYVYGFIYEINSKDEQSLDKYEDVPYSYEKKIIPLELITRSGDGETEEKKTIDALVYVDVARTSRDVPKTEYIHRINMGIKDALQKGVSQSYVDKYVRPFIPPQ
ncbi:Butirosin biosynthesis, BtrG-like protein [Lactarius hengduanensis]|nr:Butirosin biosynthesis, BtrG-like protein [Lactarius hengduanensis]